MHINMEDMRYYVEPVTQPPARPQNAPGTYTILALRYRRTDLNQRKAERLGKPMTVTSQRYEGNELWWVDEDGDHVQGALMVATGEAYRQHMVGMINDEVFAVGQHGNRMIGSSHQLIHSRRSDGRSANPNGRAITINSMPAASWALELMPEPGDTQEVVDQKVMLAKQKFFQREKKAQIYIEGIQRDWLNHLSQVRDDGHDMPVPRFRIGVTGIALIRTTPIALDDQPDTVKEAVETIQRQAIRHHYGAAEAPRSFAGINVTLATAATATDSAEVRAYSALDLNSYAAQSLGRVPLDSFVETSRFPILSTF